MFYEDEDDEQDQPQKSTWLLDSLESLFHDYEPADSRHEADTYWSTLEITNAIAAHIGIPSEDINKNEVYQVILSLGYHYTSNGGLHIDWMLKRKLYF